MSLRQTRWMYFAPAAIAFVLSGCAKNGRAWLMDNSPLLDMLFEGWKFHFGGLLLAGLMFWWFRLSYKYRGTWTPLLAAAAVAVSFSSYGLYVGYEYTHAPCEGDKRDCPTYKVERGLYNPQRNWY
jgi:hypothetical protein